MTRNRFRLIDDARLDLGYAWRTFVRTSGFFVTVLSLGLTVGATTGVYATADWLLNRSPHGVVDAERVVGLWLSEQGRADEVRYGFSFWQYLELRRIQDAFVDVAAYAKVTRFVGTPEWDVETVQQFVTGSYFPLLGVRPYLGRLIGPEDDVDGAAALVVLSHAFWQSQFGGNPDVIGSPIRVGRDPARIIGVLPPDFVDYSLDWNGPTQVWLPMRSAQSLEGMAGMLTMTQTFFMIMGRLAPGVDARIAAERAQRWVPALPPITNSLFDANAITIEPEVEMRIARREEAASFLGALLLVCVLVLLAACSNVVSFLLGRATLRRKEIALRAAMGASHARLLRQVLMEASLLAAAAGGAAIVLGIGVATLLAPLPAVYLQLAHRTAPLTTFGAVDPGMVGLTVALAFAASLVLGVLCTLGTFRNPMSSIKRSGPSWSWSRLRPSPRQGVLVLQIGLTVALAVTAALFARSFHRAANIDQEYREPESMLLARLVPINVGGDQAGPFFRALMDRLDAAPGVVAATISAYPPFAGGVSAVSPPDDPDARLQVGAATASPRFFETNGIEMLGGREFTWLEADAEAVIINHLLADRLWPGADPVGRSFTLNDASVHVIGVVDRERCRDLLAEPGPCVWRQLRIGSNRAARTVRIRTAGSPMDFLPTLRQAVRGLNPNVTIVQEQSMADFLARFVRAERTAATASSALALFGILLLAVGCASLFVSMVRDSVRELAIRMALGATSARVTARIIAQGLLLMTAGASVGLLAARLVSTRLTDQLYDVAPTDPLSYASALLLVFAVGIGAVAYAALEATRTAPAEHLHSD